MSEERREGKVQVLTNRNIREINIKNILTNIVREPNITRQELSEKNGISLMTVKHIIDELLKLGVIEEHVNQSAVGRKPKALAISAEYGMIVCINFTSVDTIRYIAYDIYGQELFMRKEKFKEEMSLEKKFEFAIAKIKEEMQAFTIQLIGVSVMVPSAYYEDTDLINYDLIPEFKDFHIKHFFTEQFGIPNVLILHDVMSAAKSEYDSYHSEGDSQFYFYYGNGIGGCFINDGTPLMGENLLAGEVGKTLMIRGEKEAPITLEEATSINALMADIQGQYDDFEEVLASYEKGNEKVCRLVDKAVQMVAGALYNTIWVLNPTRVVIDSYYPKMRELLVQELQGFLAKHSYGSIKIDAQISAANLDEFHKMKGCFNLTLEQWISTVSYM